MRAFLLSSAAVAVGTAMLAVAGDFVLIHPGTSDRLTSVTLAPPTGGAVSARPATGDITAAIEAYRKGPSEDRLLPVWEAFDDLDTKIAGLRHIGATTIGGQRSEAEVDR